MTPLSRDEVRQRAGVERASVVAALLEHVAWERLEYFDVDERVAFVHATTCAGECAYDCGGLFAVLPSDHVRRVR